MLDPWELLPRAWPLPFIRPSTQLFIHSFICSFIHLFIHSFIFIHSLIHLFIHSLIHLFTFIHSFIYLFIRPFIHSSFHSFVHSFMYSFSQSVMHNVHVCSINSMFDSIVRAEESPLISPSVEPLGLTAAISSRWRQSLQQCWLTPTPSSTAHLRRHDMRFCCCCCFASFRFVSCFFFFFLLSFV